jgi:cobalt-zinc-cadmium efflux system protein
LNNFASSTSYPANQAHHHDSGGPHQHRSPSRRLTIALALTFGYMLAEVIGGLAAHSLALIADSGRMVADSVAIGLALLAMWIAARPVSITRTFGFQRTEILAALLNALSLWLITAWIFVEAYRRFIEHPKFKDY